MTIDSERVISLVPSLTESIAVTVSGALVGATDWCIEPADLDVPRFGGTKNPDVEGIVAARPDLVVVNTEENREPDIEALRSAGLRIWRTDPTTVPAAIEQLGELLAELGATRVDWLEAAREAWAPTYEGPRVRAVVPIWRRPWMTVGRDTFTGDVLARLGVDNVLADDAERYPKIDLDALPAYDLVVLPDEPYQFGPDDGPEAFPAPARCVSGRHLTWYGPSLAEARQVLSDSLSGGLAREFGQ